MSTDYADRFSAATYAKDDPVCFTVSTRSRADRQVVELPERLFARAQSIARAYNLHLLPAIEMYAETSLDKAQCSTLLDEVRFVGRVVKDDLLVGRLREVEGVLSVCVNCAGPAAVLIEGP
jgi:hypothetical protein